MLEGNAWVAVRLWPVFLSHIWHDVPWDILRDAWAILKETHIAFFASETLKEVSTLFRSFRAFT